MKKRHNSNHTIYWVRRDLRLRDNFALEAAIRGSEKLDIVFEWDRSLKRAKHSRVDYILSTLKCFDDSLQKLGQKLILVNDIQEFLKNSKANKLVYSKSYNAKDRSLETKVGHICQVKQLDVEAIDQLCLYQISQLPFELEKLKSFTPFRKAVETSIVPLEPIPAPEYLPERGSLIQGNAQVANFKQESSAGEKAGVHRLKYYLWESARIESYKETRNGMLEFDDSSKFSPYLAIGALSPRTVYKEIKRYELEVCENESTYWLFFELLWRDYFKLYALKHGARLFDLQGPKQRQLEWIEGNELKTAFKNWKHGSTGQDFIDANMRELIKTGWMSNRGRQNVASYWAKHLCADWRLGAKWFERTLIDFDPESNWGNWAYNSGVGPDPRDRKFDPVKQSEMYDSDASYRKKFL